MSRPLRLQFPGAIYHVMARGNARAAIFADDDDRRRFLRGLDRAASRFDWAIWAFCLMPNHYHLLVQTREPTLTRGMHQLNGRYSQGFNSRQNRVGHLFQGRFKALLVEKAGYLTEVARYIVLNPVRAGLCNDPVEWRWSSYRATLGLERALRASVDVSFLRQFGEGLHPARKSFAAFVAAGMVAGEPGGSARSPVVIGSQAFEAGLMTAVDHISPEVPRRQRTRQALADYERLCPTRDVAIQTAFASGAYTLKEIGAHFGLAYSRVSRIARRQDDGGHVHAESGAK